MTRYIIIMFANQVKRFIKSHKKIMVVYVVLLLCLIKISVVYNHAHSSEPLMLLVSFDGFRWDYLEKHNLPNFNFIKQNGVYADYIYNAFATATLPNHWTIVTGLYEESHGIIQNQMYDPVLRLTYDLSVTGSYSDARWYTQNPAVEPIWVTNQKGGSNRKSAAEWIGNDIKIHDQEIISVPYNRSRPYNEIIDEFIQLFTKEGSPINFGAIYFDEPDHTGHRYGPYSPQMAEKLKFCDDTLGYLIQQLKDHHLFDKLNLIVTSDHGMEKISEENARYLDKYVNTSLFDAYGSRALLNIFVKSESDLSSIYEKISKIPNLGVYYKKDLPNELNYKNNVRVGDIVVIAEIGHSVYAETRDLDWSILNGDHGFLNNYTSMYPIFLAHGPAFKDGGYKVKSFRNVDIYPLMCFLLGVQPAIHNGSLENVLDLLKMKYYELNAASYFILLLLIPAAVISCTTICIKLISKRRLAQRIDSIEPKYRRISTSEARLLDV